MLELERGNTRSRCLKRLWTCRKTHYVINVTSIPLYYLILSFKVFLFITLHLYFLLTKRGESFITASLLAFYEPTCIIRMHNKIL